MDAVWKASIRAYVDFRVNHLSRIGVGWVPPTPGRSPRRGRGGAWGFWSAEVIGEAPGVGGGCLRRGYLGTDEWYGVSEGAGERGCGRVRWFVEVG
jgi:hypothetical protein